MSSHEEEYFGSLDDEGKQGVLDAIFHACDTNNMGEVSVDCVLDYIRNELNLVDNSICLDGLVMQLHGSSVNGILVKHKFYSIMESWIDDTYQIIQGRSVLSDSNWSTTSCFTDFQENDLLFNSQVSKMSCEILNSSGRESNKDDSRNNNSSCNPCQKCGELRVLVSQCEECNVILHSENDLLRSGVERLQKKEELLKQQEEQYRELQCVLDTKEAELMNVEKEKMQVVSEVLRLRRLMDKLEEEKSALEDALELKTRDIVHLRETLQSEKNQGRTLTQHVMKLEETMREYEGREKNMKRAILDFNDLFQHLKHKIGSEFSALLEDTVPLSFVPIPSIHDELEEGNQAELMLSPIMSVMPTSLQAELEACSLLRGNPEDGYIRKDSTVSPVSEEDSHVSPDALAKSAGGSSSDAAYPPGATHTEMVSASRHARRCVSDAGLPVKATSFPGIPDAFLQELGLLGTPADGNGNAANAEQDTETKYVAISLAMRTDRLTLEDRHQLIRRLWEQAERNVQQEAGGLLQAINRLNYLCTDSESINILTEIKEQLKYLLSAIEKVSGRAQDLGAVREELRVSRAWDVAVAHVENVQLLLKSAKSDLEMSRRTQSDSHHDPNEVGAGPGGVGGGIDVKDKFQLHTSTPLNRIGAKRRASIAAFTRSINNSNQLSNGCTAPAASGRLGASCCDVVTANPGTRLHQRVSRCEGSLLAEISDIPHDDILDENEPLRASMSRQHSGDGKAGRPDDRLAMVGHDGPMGGHGSHWECVHNPQDVGNSEHEDEDVEEVDGSLAHCKAEMVPSVASHFMRECTELATGLANSLVPDDVNQLVRMVRRLVAVFLLVSAAWCMVRVLVPTTASPCRLIPFSWLTWKELLDPFIVVRHYGPPPT